MKAKTAFFLIVAIACGVLLKYFFGNSDPVAEPRSEAAQPVSIRDLTVIDQSARKRFPKVQLDRTGKSQEVDRESDLAKELRRVLFKRALVEDETRRNPRFYTDTEEQVRSQKKPLIAKMKQTQIDRFGGTQVEQEEVLVASSVDCRVQVGDHKSVEPKDLEKEACIAALESIGGWQAGRPIEIEYRELDLNHSSVDVQLAWGRLIQDEMTWIVLTRYLNEARNKSGG